MNGSDIFERVAPSVVMVQTEEGAGTGFLARTDGVVVTNYHVVHPFTTVQIETRDGECTPARLIRANKEADLAALIPANPEFRYGRAMRPLTIRSRAATRVGEDVLAIGHPGQASSYSLARGVVSSASYKRPGSEISHLQLNISINPGNSGGPIVDCSGEVVGVATEIIFDPYSRSRIEGIGLAVPANLVAQFLSDVPKLKGDLLAYQYCSACGGCEKGRSTCSHCGKRFETQLSAPPESELRKHLGTNCSVCNHKFGAAQAYCTNCGARFSSET